ncbi:MAG: acetylornithine carbamoyltransferase [Bacteroidetes bacterium]|nr:acetylornithine carbamoyltransferase [Bacteroidota bacterium]
MRNFTSVKDVTDVNDLVQEAIYLKNNPYSFKELGQNKTLGMIFFNPSLRTSLSTQKAAYNLGMNVMIMNMDKEGWALETMDGAVMNGSTVEHIKEAAAVMGQYCDIIGIRTFPGLLDRDKDYSEDIIKKFIRFSGVPVLSLESSTLHPLQSLADLLTITESASWFKRPKVVLTWAPHVKPLPQAVANSFCEWMLKSDLEFVVAQPAGYELSPSFTDGAFVTNNQEEALKNADFVYVKNWSSFSNYGKLLPLEEDWMLTERKLSLSNNAKIMHCLPVRREVELPGDIIDCKNSLILQQSSNRLWAAQAVLKKMLEELENRFRSQEASASLEAVE